jgi:hypothetical protein
MDTDRNLLFGVLALQARLIDPTQFAEACTAWSARKTPLADLLVQRGWLTPQGRADVERLLDRQLREHGDPRSGLAAVTTDEVERALADVGGGMRPKLGACVEAIRAGVRSAHIIDGSRPHSLLLELFTDAGIGTMVTP